MYLQQTFQQVSIEEMYSRYWLRLSRVFCLKLLSVLILFGIGIIILYNTVGNLQVWHVVTVLLITFNNTLYYQATGINSL